MITIRHHTGYEFPGRVTCPTQRTLPDNTLQSQLKDFHAPDGIRTHSTTKRTAAERHLRPRVHWDQQQVFVRRFLLKVIKSTSITYQFYTLLPATEFGFIWLLNRL